MPKNKEFMGTGWRQWYSIKGCHSCLECQHCKVHAMGEKGLVYKCDKFIGKTSNLDVRFPYDNTKCKEFQEQSTEG
jgi:hypothetical protein